MSLQPLEAQQGPDQKTMVKPAVEMLIELGHDEFLVKPGARQGSLIEQDFLDVFHGWAAVPVFVGRGKASFMLLSELTGQIPLHGPPQDALAFG